MDSAREVIQRYKPDLADQAGSLVTDTTEFMRIGPGDVIRLSTGHYLVHRDAVESGPGYTDTKYWVKKCTELETGRSKLLKLVFHESFHLTYGCVRITCYRSPRKEARMLDLVRDDTRFMQGRSVEDEAGNRIRVIDIIAGKRIDHVVGAIKADHETYFHDHFPAILGKFLGACEAIALLHELGEVHGDIHLDHLMREYETGAYRWIDFDYAYETQANPFGLDLFGLGRILSCLVGKWTHTPQTLRELGIDFDTARLSREDFSCVHGNEIMNLRKVFPYIPERLNRVLLHFSGGADICYETVPEFMDDLRASASSTT